MLRYFLQLVYKDADQQIFSSWVWSVSSIHNVLQQHWSTSVLCAIPLHNLLRLVQLENSVTTHSGWSNLLRCLWNSVLIRSSYESFFTNCLQFWDRIALGSIAMLPSVGMALACCCRGRCRRWRSCRPHGSVGLISRKKSCINRLHTGRTCEGTHQPVINTVFVISVHTRQET